MSQMPEFQKVSLDGPEPVLFTGEMVSNRSLLQDHRLAMLLGMAS